MQRRIFLGVFALVLLACLATGAGAYLSASRSLEQAAVEKLEAVAENQKTAILALTASYQEQLDLVARSAALLRALEPAPGDSPPAVRDRLLSILDGKIGAGSPFRYLTIADPAGRTLASIGPQSLQRALDPAAEASPSGRRARIGGSHGIIETSDGQQLFGLSSEIVSSRQGTVIAVIHAWLPPDEIYGITGWSTGLGHSGETLLAARNADGDAVVLTPLRSDPEAALRRIVPKERLDVPVTRALLGQEASLEQGHVDDAGVPVLAVTRYLAALDWGLVAKINRAEVGKPIDSIRDWIVAIALVVTLLGAGVSLLLSSGFSGPIRELSRTTERIAEGGLGERAPELGRSEVGQLARSFNRMLDRLTDAQSRIGEQSALRETVIDTAVDGIITIDKNGTVISFNPACERIFGYAAGEVVGRNVKCLMPEHFAAAHDGYLAHHLDTGERKIIGVGRTVEGKRKSGEIFPMDLAVGRAEIGDSLVFVGTVRDITERSAMQAQIGEQFALNRTVVETAVDGIITIEQDGTVISFNPACERIFGYAAKEIVGRNVKCLMPQHFATAHDSYLAHHLKTGEKKIIGVGREVEGLRKSGEVFPMDLAVGRTEVGDRFVFVGTVRDISERRALEQANQRGAQAMRLLQQITSDFNEARDFKAAARACLREVCAYAHWQAGHIQLVRERDGKVIGTEIWHADPAAAFDPLREALAGAAPANRRGVGALAVGAGGPVWIEDLDGGRAFDQGTAALRCGLHSAYGVPIEVGAKTVAALEFFTIESPPPDPQLEHTIGQVAMQLGRVFERARYTAALERREQDLALTNRHLEEFAYVASHDLKAPLRGIDNLSQWIVEDMDERLTEDSRKNIGRLQQRVKRLERLIDDLLTFSRAGRADAEQRLVDSGAMLRAYVESLDLPPGLTVEISSEMPVFETHATPLETVFRNLVGNAIKHRDRDEITVAVDCHHLGAFYEFTVRDNGAGIAPEYQERVFGLFQTLTPRDEKEASGMGLAIVKRLVESVGGRISLSSDPDSRDTRFEVLWPTDDGEDTDREILHERNAAA